MATHFRFGSASVPCRTVKQGIAEVAEETEDEGSCDKLVQCPYDKNHQIRVCRFPYHIIKCRKNHPKLASELKSCPFNARHLLPKQEIQRHIEMCEDRVPVYPQDGADRNGLRQWQVPVSTWVNPNTSEDWELEVDANAPVFVLGMNSTLNQSLETRPINQLGPSFRAPSSTPWST